MSITLDEIIISVNLDPNSELAKLYKQLREFKSKDGSISVKIKTFINKMRFQKGRITMLQKAITSLSLKFPNMFRKWNPKLLEIINILIQNSVGVFQNSTDVVMQEINEIKKLITKMPEEMDKLEKIMKEVFDITQLPSLEDHLKTFELLEQIFRDQVDGENFKPLVVNLKILFDDLFIDYNRESESRADPTSNWTKWEKEFEESKIWNKHQDNLLDLQTLWDERKKHVHDFLGVFDEELTKIKKEIDIDLEKDLEKEIDLYRRSFIEVFKEAFAWLDTSKQILDPEWIRSLLDPDIEDERFDSFDELDEEARELVVLEKAKEALEKFKNNTEELDENVEMVDNKIENEEL